MLEQHRFHPAALYTIGLILGAPSFLHPAHAEHVVIAGHSSPSEQLAIHPHRRVVLPRSGGVETDDVHFVSGCLAVGSVLTIAILVTLVPLSSRSAEVRDKQSIIATLKTMEPGGTPRPARSPVLTWAITLPSLAYGFALASQGIVMSPMEAERLWPQSASVALGGMATLMGLTQLIGPQAGHWSDMWRSRLGRRRPLILISVALVSISSLGLWILSRLWFSWTYLAVLVVQQLAWNILMSTQLGLVSDLVAPSQRGFAGGTSTVNLLVGALLGLMSVGALSASDYHANYGVMVGLVVLTGLIVCCVADEESSLHRPFDCHRPDRGLGYLGFSIHEFSHSYLDTGRHSGFFMLMITKTLYSAGVVVKGFLLFFAQDTFRLQDQGAEGSLTAQLSVSAEAAAACAAVVVTVFLGSGSSHLLKSSSTSHTTEDHLTSLYSVWALVVGALWMSLLWLGPVFVGLRVQEGFPHAGLPAVAAWFPTMLSGTAIWGIGMGVYLVGDQALSLALLPDREHSGRCLGLISVCNCVGGVIGGSVVGVLLSGFGAGAERGAKYNFFGYAAIFALASFFSLSIAVLGFKIRSSILSQMPLPVRSRMTV